MHEDRFRKKLIGLAKCTVYCMSGDEVSDDISVAWTSTLHFLDFALFWLQSVCKWALKMLLFVCIGSRSSVIFVAWKYYWHSVIRNGHQHPWETSFSRKGGIFSQAQLFFLSDLLLITVAVSSAESECEILL